MDVHVRVRRWGNSMGLVLPKDVVEALGVSEGEELILGEVRKGERIQQLFGVARSVKGSAQKLKDEMRKGWGD
ncbi:MAG: AbrB/MazE/SpoVT family DNA-binding domain-containing protein [Candidatus Bilamarchaeaceae archaeon]